VKIMTETRTVEFPELNGDGQLIIVKRFPNGQESKKYRYSFYHTESTDHIISELKELLSQKMDLVHGNTIPFYHPDLEESPVYVELTEDNFPYWGNFIGAIVSSENRSRRIPKNLESSLKGYLFYLYSQEYIIGYARRLYPSKVIKKRVLKINRREGVKVHPEALIEKEILLNSIEEVEGIEIDNFVDFIFVITLDECGNAHDSWAIVFNKCNFESILDVYEHQKTKALSIFSKCTMLAQVLTEQDLEEIRKHVERNRQLHKMLLNPVVEKHMNEVDINDLKFVKEKFEDGVSFDIDDNGEKLIFPREDMEKLRAIREIIGVIGCRFGRTVNNKHVFKGKPEEIR